MKTINLYEKGEEVLIKCVIEDISMDNGEILYSVKSTDTGKNMGVWFKDNQLEPMDSVTKEG